MSNKPNWSKQTVGNTGVRRIVPMLGVSYIAGQITIKKKPYSGNKSASMGGRTRYWSTTNFLNISSGRGRTTPYTSEEIDRIERFSATSTFSSLTIRNPQTLNALQTDFKAGNVAHGIDPADCLYLYQYLWRAAYAYAAAGGTLPQVATWPLV